MVTMIDEIYDRLYQGARGDLSAALVTAASRLGGAMRNAFAVLNRIEYSEPWATKSSKARYH